MLADNPVSIGDIHTERFGALFSGESMFKAIDVPHLPAGLDEHALKGALESLANELMVDVGLRDR